MQTFESAAAVSTLILVGCPGLAVSSIFNIFPEGISIPSPLGPALVSARQVSLGSFALAPVASDLFSVVRIEKSSQKIHFFNTNFNVTGLDEPFWRVGCH